MVSQPLPEVVPIRTKSANGIFKSVQLKLLEEVVRFWLLIIICCVIVVTIVVSALFHKKSNYLHQDYILVYTIFQ